jgi:hypothetical protein
VPYPAKADRESWDPGEALNGSRRAPVPLTEESNT